MDESLSTGGLANYIDECRDLLNNGFVMKPEKLDASTPHKSTAIGIRDSDGNHSIAYFESPNTLQPGAGVSISGESATSGQVLHTFNDGTTIEQFNYPATLVPSEAGWNYIKNSPVGSDPVQIIEDIKNNGWTVFQQKTNEAFTTSHKIPENDYKCLVNAAFVKKINDPSSDFHTVQYLIDNVPSNLNFVVRTKIVNGNLVLKSAYVE